MFQIETKPDGTGKRSTELFSSFWGFLPGSTVVVINRIRIPVVDNKLTAAQQSHSQAANWGRKARAKLLVPGVISLLP